MTPQEQVVAAWTDAGPVPSYHYAAQARLQAEWPALAQALDRLAAEHLTR